MHVYNAPSAMPKLTSKLTQNKIKNNLINSNITEYDKWVSNLQLNKNNEVWLNKGNDINYNYSAYNFNGIIYKESDRPKIFNNGNYNTTSNVINASSNTTTVTSDDNNDIINGNGSNIITKSSTTIGSGGGIHIILNTNKHVNFDEDINITDHQQQQHEQHEQQIGVLRLQSDSNDGNYSPSINDSEFSPKSFKKSLSSNFLSYNDVDFNNNIIDNEYNDMNSVNNDNNSNNIIMLNTINNITSDYMSIANNNISNNLLLNPLPTYMIISVSTYNQIIKADSILDNHNNHNYIKKVLSNIKLVELKMLITQTIIKGLEIAFHKQNQSHYLYKYYKYLHQQMKNDITNKIIEFNNYYNINLTFQCYYSYIPGWKIINDENDWFNAKHIVYNTFLNISKQQQQQQQQNDNNHQHSIYDPNRSFLSYNSTTNSSNYHQQQQQYSNLPTIKLIYSLSHESELKLLEQIQKFYKYQKEQFLLQSNPHISLKSLTETLDNNISIKNNNYQNHNNNNNNTNNKIGINSSATTSNTVNNNIDNNNNKLKSKKTIITLLSSNASVSSGATVSSASMPSLSLYKNDLNITNNDNNNSDNNVPTNKMKVKVILKKKSSSEVENNNNDSNIHNNDKTTTNIHINNYNLPLTATTLTNHEYNNNNSNNTNTNNISNNNSNYTTAATLPLVKISSTSNTNYIQDNNIDHNKNLVFITKPKKTSIFYPQRKESLDQLYEKLEISLPKQYDYANNLEQKILKTKW